MSFAYPIILALLCLPIIIAFMEWFRKGHPLVMPFDFNKKRHGFWWKLLIYMANCLPPMIMLVSLLILANPLRVAPPKTERQVTNIQFCLDVSGSMLWGMNDEKEPSGKNRYDIAMEAINQFTTYRKGDAFGLTIFSWDYLHWVPLTQDLSAIRFALPFTRPTFPGWGGTSIGKALLGCIEVFEKRDEGDRMIILVTDGTSDDIMNGKSDAVIKKLKENKIVVYIISLTAGEPVSEMGQIANATGGKVFTAVNKTSLKQVFQRIDKMKKTKIKTKSPITIDYFEPFAIAGLICASLSLLCSFGLRYTPW